MWDFGESMSDMKEWEGVAFKFWRTSSVYGSINACFSSWAAIIND